MKKLIFVAISILLNVIYANADKIRVVDADDRMPVQGATVFARGGTILGITDNNGEIEISSDKDYPLLVSCMGYNPKEVNKTIPTVLMTPATYQLKELVVTPTERPIERVVCYMREYLTGVADKDTVIYYNEHIADYFLTDGKVKGFKQHLSPRILSSRLYAKISNEQVSDSIFRPDYRDDTLSWEMFAILPSGNNSTAEILKGESTAKVEGKYSTREWFKDTPNTLTIRKDNLADTKEHSISPVIFKLIGFTVDFNELMSTWVYTHNDSGIYSIKDLISSNVSCKVLGRGKWIKRAFNTTDPVEMKANYEVYPLEIQHLTVKEAKDLLKNAPSPDITASPNATPLPPEIQRIVTIATSKK